MPTIRIPSPMRPYVNGKQVVAVKGQNAAEAVESLLSQFPTLRTHLTNGRGELRPFVNLFLGENNIREMQGLDTPLGESDQLILIPLITGG